MDGCNPRRHSLPAPTIQVSASVCAPMSQVKIVHAFGILYCSRMVAQRLQQVATCAEHGRERAADPAAAGHVARVGQSRAAGGGSAARRICAEHGGCADSRAGCTAGLHGAAAAATRHGQHADCPSELQ